MKRWKTKSGYEIIQILSGRSNVFLLTNGEKNILIDTSVPRLWNRLQQRLKKLGINNIDYLILTHAHFDHAANANQIKKRYNALVIVQNNEANCLLNGDNIILKGTTIFTRPIVNILGKRLFPRFKYEPCKYDLLVDSYLDLNFLGFNAYLIHTPGHTIGSMSFIVDDEIAMVGDTMFGVFKWSVFPPFAEDSELMIKSWGKLLETNCSIFIPSHGTENSRLLVQKEYKKRLKTITAYNMR
ncbi:MAG: MBL fold metallo-hydrolase [Bacteroidales bacterium]|jgi:glyoxylase-like metal-dependent hydrolase (beta-lactamase superfamily II)